MNNQDYGGIQWIQQHASAVDSESDMLENGAADSEVTASYLVNGNATDEDLDHMAAENLIFMARDGQLSEIIAANESGGGTVLITDSGVAYAESFDDDAQVVTEEIITDDWVQHQGAERVEIAAEQIAGNANSLELLDMEQDEYTALRPYPCDFCSRRFRKKASLNNHMLAHQNDRPHLCKLCGARFSRRAELISHFKAHAEAQDAADAEAAAAASASIKFEPQQHRQVDDHFYEQEWPLYQDQEHEHMQEQGQQLDQEQLTVASQVVQQASYASVSDVPPPTAARGRISRLKPKEESTQYIVIAEKQTTEELQQFVDCEELTPQLTTSATSNNSMDTGQSMDASRYPVLDDSKPFVCQQCGLAFAREKALVSHIKNHRVDSPFECNQCQEMFWDNQRLQEHQKTHQFEESNSEYDPASAGDDSASESEPDQLYGDFYCSECGISFHRQDLLRRHAKQQHKLSVATTLHAADVEGSADADADGDGDGDGDGDAENTKDAPHCCHTCGKSFPSALELLAHAEIHARFPPFKCVLCGISFYEEQAIKRHLNTRHPHELKPNSCVLCGKECRDRKALIKHAWDHSREKCHSCSKCGKNFHNKARLKRHMASHRDKSVVCEVCHEEFPDGRTLSNHRHSHSTTSPGKLFPCHECGKTFGSRSSQQIHVRIHTGERPYGCRYCWKAFADGGTLRKHERIHTGEKPYACSVCPRAFNQRVVLREHIRSHHSGLDAVRGTYHCTVCTADLSSSNELIQHLIQHSDTNTAKQRQPITGPRKYKRRRKLQPHEIAHMRAENKDADDYGSDMDLCDLDVENVDDLFDAAEPTPPKREKRKRNAASQAKPGANCVSTGALNNNTTSAGKSANGSQDRMWEEKFLQANGNGNGNGNAGNQLNDFFQIDSLVVVNDTTLQPVSSSSGGTVAKTRRSGKLQLQASNSNSNSGKSTATAATSAAAATAATGDECSKSNASVSSNSRSSRKKPGKSSKNSSTTASTSSSTRPRMIHTEKSRLPPDNGTKKTRGRSYVTRTSTSESSQLGLVKSSGVASSRIVDDYEIISPATQPPNQISSSPLHIKQEQEQQQQRVPLMFDETHLLIDAALLREKTYEKFNPSIVNDLEEILRSPLKHDRNARLRFTSESSTTPQFLPEEEQNLIKIEPTSPDLREMVESQQRVSSTGHTTTPSSSSSSSAARTSRHLRQITANSSSRAAMKRHNSSSSGNKTVSASSSKKSASSSTSVAVSKANSYLSYGVDAYNVNVTNNANSSDVSSGFFSISEVVSAADAADAAAKAAAANKTERQARCYECEMCSANFPDRAQLLEHVHIHI